MTTFQEGGLYRAPDKRRYRARLENSRMGSKPAWTLVGVDLEQIDDYSWRDRLSQLLFVEKEKIVLIQPGTDGFSIRETAWDTADFVRE